MKEDILQEIATYFEQPSDDINNWEFVPAKKAKIAKQLRDLSERLHHLSVWPQ